MNNKAVGIVCFVCGVYALLIVNYINRHIAPKINPLDAKLWYYKGANAYQNAMHQSENTDELRANIQANFERDSLANFETEN